MFSGTFPNRTVELATRFMGILTIFTKGACFPQDKFLEGEIIGSFGLEFLKVLKVSCQIVSRKKSSLLILNKILLSLLVLKIEGWLLKNSASLGMGTCIWVL